MLFDEDGKLAFDRDRLRVAARSVLVAGGAIGADKFLANMGTEEFLACLSRPALEASCKDTAVLLRQRVKDTRAALVEHFRDGHFVHPAALFAPDAMALSAWLTQNSVNEDAGAGATGPAAGFVDDETGGDAAENFREAAE